MIRRLPLAVCLTCWFLLACSFTLAIGAVNVFVVVLTSRSTDETLARIERLRPRKVAW